MRKEQFLSIRPRNLSSPFHSNTNTKITGPASTHQDVDLSVNSQYGPSYIFESCTFSSLVNTGDGGAITCTGSVSDSWKPQLIIQRCSFHSCNSSSGFGGGVYAGGLPSSFVEKSTFVGCHSIEKRGGGIYLSSSVGFPVVSDNAFISCYARVDSGSSGSVDDGGGIYITVTMLSTQLYYILQSCRFVSCGCYSWGGGVYVYSPSAIVSCSDSLFSSCTSLGGKGIGTDLRSTHSEFLTFFCFFTSEPSNSLVPDISINHNAGTFSESSILHSFTTNDASKSVKTYVDWKDPTLRNWLPQGVIK